MKPTSVNQLIPGSVLKYTRNNEYSYEVIRLDKDEVVVRSVSDHRVYRFYTSSFLNGAWESIPLFKTYYDKLYETS